MRYLIEKQLRVIRERGFLWLILGGCLYLIVILSMRVYDLYQNMGQLDRAEAEIKVLASENLALSEELVRVQDEEYVEEVARNKMQLSQPGETVLLIPGDIPIQVGGVESSEILLPARESWWDRIFGFIDELQGKERGV